MPTKKPKKAVSNRPAPGKDWRSLPRKADEAKRTTRLTLKVTASEFQRLKDNAAAASMSMADYVVLMCCGKRWSAT
jgi:hypothetical protein